MSSQKLQLDRLLKVIPSDTIDIPNIATKNVSSTSTGTTANKLVDSGQAFTTDGTKVGAIVYNDTDAAVATVTAIDSDTVLSLSADVVPTGKAYRIFRDKTDQAMLYVGVTGNVKVRTHGDEDVIIPFASNGWHPINIKRIFVTDTTATDLLVGW